MPTQFLIVRAGGYRDGWLSSRALIETLPGEPVSLEFFLPPAAGLKEKQLTILTEKKRTMKMMQRDSFEKMPTVRAYNKRGVVEVLCEEIETASAIEKRSLGIVLHKAFNKGGEMEILFEPERNWEYFYKNYPSSEQSWGNNRSRIRDIFGISRS